MAVDVFEVWYPDMGKNEGGYVKHPFDPGGDTNKGVTLETFQSLAPSVLGVAGTLDNLKKMTDVQHKLIAKWYWNNLAGTKISTYAIRNYGIQFQAIEQFWGSGGANMHPLQHAVNRYRADKISVDGRFGPVTLKALNDVTDQEGLFHAVYEARLNFYDAIIANNPKFNSFRNGWQKRLMLGYAISCKTMGYQTKANLYDRLIKWSPYGPKVLPFDVAVPGVYKLNGEKFNDPGFRGNPLFDPRTPDKKYWLSTPEQIAEAVTEIVSEKKNIS